ncbi:MAG: flavin reductase family protein [Campylobacterota bacterium]
MIIDPTGLKPDIVYKLMSNTIFPRPIAWISTVGEGGVNLAPYSYFIPVSTVLPCVMVSFGRHENGGLKDSIRNILDTGKATISLAHDIHASPIEASAEPLPYGVSESEHCGIDMKTALEGYPPMVTDAKAALLCSLHQITELKESPMSIAFLRIEHFYYAEGVVDERYNVHLQNIGRVGRDYLVGAKRIKG